MGPVLLTATSLNLTPAVCLTSTFLTPGSTQNLSGEDTGDWYSEMNPAPIGGPGDNTRLTVPIVTGGISDATVGETTSRIPVFDVSGRAVAPGEESLRALEEEQARIAEVSAIPPSFTPKDVPDDEDDSKLPDEHLFGQTVDQGRCHHCGSDIGSGSGCLGSACVPILRRQSCRCFQQLQ